MRSGDAATDQNDMPATAPTTDPRSATHFPAVLIRPNEDVAELQRRLEACLLIVRHVGPALSSAR